MTTQPNGDYVRSKVGLNGLLTNGIGFTVLGGWGSTFFDAKGGGFDLALDDVAGQVAHLLEHLIVGERLHEMHASAERA